MQVINILGYDIYSEFFFKFSQGDMTRIWLGSTAFDKHRYWGIYRPESASPATGSATTHKREQETLLQQAFEAEKSV